LLDRQMPEEILFSSSSTGRWRWDAVLRQQSGRKEEE